MRWLLLKCAISVALIALLLHNRDLSEIVRGIAAINPFAFVLAVILLAVISLPAALRWQEILRSIGHPISIREAFPIVLIGQFFSQTLPSAIGGDAMRVWEAHRTGMPASGAISSVMIDRAAGLLAMLLLVSALLPLLFAIIDNPVVTAGVMVLLAVGYAGVGAAMLLDRVPSTLLRFRLIRGIARFSQDLRTVLLTPRPAAIVLFFGLICHLGIVAVAYVLARGLGLPIDAKIFLVIVPIANFTTMLPISIGGWGVRESAFVVGFGLVGVAPTDAFVVSVLVGLSNIIVGLAGGPVWLARRHSQSKSNDVDAPAPLRG